MKKKHIVIPAVLLVYLMAMSYIGYGNYVDGHYSALHYFGTVAGSLIVIIILFFSLRKREQLKREREEDMKRSGEK